MSEQELWLPNGLDFSPYYEGILQGALAICFEANGNHEIAKSRIAETFYSGTNNPSGLAGNCLSGMKSYGLIEEYVPTELGLSLLDLDSKEEVCEKFALHLIFHCYGYELLDCIEEIELYDGWHSDKKVQASEKLLEIYGIETAGGGNGKAVPTMKLWLAETGLFPKRSWKLNHTRYNELLGANRDVIESLSSLKYEDQCFLKTLLDLYVEGQLSTDEDGSIDTNKVRAETEKRYRVRLSKTNLPQDTLFALRDQGLIELTYSGDTGSHGGSRYYAKPSSNLLEEDLSDFVSRLGLDGVINPQLRKDLRKSYADVIAMCNSDNTYEKGVGLELLSLKMLKAGGLQPLEMRSHSDEAAGPEIDLLFYDDRGSYSSWQVQCKNTNSISSDRVYREIGIAYVAKRDVVCLIATGLYTESAYAAARKANQTTSMSVILISGEDVSRLIAESITADALLREKMSEVKRLKQRKHADAYVSSDF